MVRGTMTTTSFLFLLVFFLFVLVLLVVEQQHPGMLIGQNGLVAVLRLGPKDERLLLVVGGQIPELLVELPE